MAASKKVKAEAEADAPAREAAAKGARRTAAEPERAKPEAAAEEQPMSRDEVIRRYLRIYERCTQEEPKAFDAKGALSALDQIAKALGYDAPARAEGQEGGAVRIVLDREAWDNGG